MSAVPNPGRKFLSKIETETDVLTNALNRIRHVYDLFDHVAVSFSGGKDSTAVLNLALQVAKERGRLPLRVIFFDEECIYTENVDYVRRVAENPDVALEWYCLPVKHRNATSTDEPYWYPWAPEAEHKWVRPLPPEAITQLPGYDHSDPKHRLSIPEISGLVAPAHFGSACLMLGIRADESITRLRAVAARKEDNYIVRHLSGYGGAGGMLGNGNVWKAYPIYDWRTPDVWFAPKSLGWDYCRVYDQMDQMGRSPSQQRLAPPFGEEPMQGLAEWQIIEPQLWAKMTARVPGAATGRRYARTELYAFGGTPKRPYGVSYETLIRDTITQKHDAESQPLVAKSLSSIIARHYRKTQDSLGPADHPETGIGWEFLLMLATRGDFKNRKQPRMGFTTDSDYPQRLAKYQTALRQYTDDLDIETRTLAAGQETPL